MKKALIIFIFLNSLTTFSQIIIGGDEKPPKKQKKPKTEKIATPIDSLNSKDRTEIFIGSNWSSTYRRLIENDNIFGDSIGLRADETSVGRWSFSLGVRSKLSKYLMFEGGISYLQNGEKYEFTATDTSHTYTNSYKFIGMPLRLYGVFGEKKWRFQVGIGGIPQMALRFKQESKFVDSEAKETSITNKTKIGMSSFVFSVAANAGVQYEFLPTWSLFVMPEYRVQLTSSLLKTSKFKHYGNAFGVGFGIVKAF